MSTLQSVLDVVSAKFNAALELDPTLIDVIPLGSLLVIWLCDVYVGVCGCVLGVLLFFPFFFFLVCCLVFSLEIEGSVCLWVYVCVGYVSL